jgi:hypothetical protein
MTRKLIDLTGQHFGRLTVVRRAPNKGIRTMWECLCIGPHNPPGDRITVVQGLHLKSGDTKSCGCLHNDSIRKHGHNKRGARSPEYNSWANMIARCYNPKHNEYHNYGGRGIGRWRVIRELLYGYSRIFRIKAITRTYTRSYK